MISVIILSSSFDRNMIATLTQSLALSAHTLEDYLASLPTSQLLLLSGEEEEGFLYRSTWSIKSGCQFSPLITRPNSENNDAASQHPLTADLLSPARSIIF